MRRASSEVSLKYRYCSSPLVRSDWNCIHVLSYLIHLEELGIEIYEDISDGVLENTLLRQGGGSSSLGHL